MIGQERLLKHFDTFDGLPEVTVLFGNRGSGKKTLVNEVCKNIGVNSILIDKTLTDEYKDELFSSPIVAVLVFDLTSTPTRQSVTVQNSILKFIEELPNNYRVFILAENETYLLNTVLNRGRVYVMDDYIDDEIRQLFELYNPQLLTTYTPEQFNYFRYPLEIIEAPTQEGLTKVEKLVDTMLTSITKANLSNLLSISKKIDIDGNNDELINLTLFLNVLSYKLYKHIIQTFNPQLLMVYNLLNKLIKNINKSNVNKQYILETFLVTMREVMDNNGTEGNKEHN